MTTHIRRVDIEQSPYHTAYQVVERVIRDMDQEMRGTETEVAAHIDDTDVSARRLQTLATLLDLHRQMEAMNHKLHRMALLAALSGDKTLEEQTQQADGTFVAMALNSAALSIMLATEGSYLEGIELADHDDHLEQVFAREMLP